jgi:hypothetical protein
VPLPGFQAAIGELQCVQYGCDNGRLDVHSTPYGDLVTTARYALVRVVHERGLRVVACRPFENSYKVIVLEISERVRSHSGSGYSLVFLTFGMNSSRNGFKEPDTPFERKIIQKTRRKTNIFGPFQQN